MRLIRQQMTKTHTRGRQRGAVILLVTFSLVALLGLAALALDLGRVYIIESQLQNAADAGALRGAKDLDGTADQLDDACQRAVEGALTNKFLLVAGALAEEDLTVEVSARPFGPGSSWVTLKSPGGACSSGGVTIANDYYFMRVTADASSVPSLLGGVLGIWENSAKALAVAGRYLLPIAPLGVCAVRPHACTGQSHCESASINASLSGGNLEYGFIRGVAYNIPALNPLFFQAVPMWVNPVDAPPAPCSGSHDSASYVAPFVCTGSIASIRSVPGFVYVNTGTDASLRKALNSRFDDPQAFPNPCNPLTAPPDSNVKQYTAGAAGTGRPAVWMAPDPSQQVAQLDQTIRQQIESGALPLGAPGASNPATWRGSLTQAQWGVLWSYGPERNFGVTPSADFTTGDWTTVPLYAGIAPTYPGVVPPFPYKAGGQFQENPPTHQGKADRRLLNMVIIDCSTPPGPSACGPGTSHAMLPVVAIGQFFMQKEADFAGSPKKIEAEFAGIVAPPLPSGEIKLYR